MSPAFSNEGEKKNEEIFYFSPCLHTEKYILYANMNCFKYLKK